MEYTRPAISRPANLQRHPSRFEISDHFYQECRLDLAETDHLAETRSSQFSIHKFRTTSAAFLYRHSVQTIFTVQKRRPGKQALCTFRTDTQRVRIRSGNLYNTASAFGETFKRFEFPGEFFFKGNLPSRSRHTHPYFRRALLRTVGLNLADYSERSLLPASSVIAPCFTPDVHSNEQEPLPGAGPPLPRLASRRSCRFPNRESSSKDTATAEHGTQSLSG